MLSNSVRKSKPSNVIVCADKLLHTKSFSPVMDAVILLKPVQNPTYKYYG